MEITGFLHFGINTFTGKEWGYGDEDPGVFLPTDFDADAIVEPLKEAGFGGVILTCKHHDGFCLWPTRSTDHSVRNSPWKGGRGDVVRSISEAAARHGLRFGIYVSPWDRNSNAYGTPAYLAVYRQQLTELLTNYGPLFEVWFDGANGGDGFYGGAREKRTIDKRHYYEWPRIRELVRKLQPGALMFSDVGPDLRWVGNERGAAGEPCWSTIDPEGNDGGPAAPGDVNVQISEHGTPSGRWWMPAECDVSIRPGWFWHAAESTKVKSPEQLLDLYLNSVGRGAGLLLNTPPDRRGRLDDHDLDALRGFTELRKRLFSNDALQRRATLQASNVRGGDPRFAASRVTDGDPSTFWSTDDGIHQARLDIRFDEPTRIDALRLSEAIELGQRIRRFTVKAIDAGTGGTLAEGTSMGLHRILKLPPGRPVRGITLQLVADAPIALSEVAAFTQGF